MPYMKTIKLVLVATSLIAMGSVLAQADTQKIETIEDNNRSDRAEHRSEHRENRAGRREQRRENFTAHRGRSQGTSANRASGGRRR